MGKTNCGACNMAQEPWCYTNTCKDGTHDYVSDYTGLK